MHGFGTDPIRNPTIWLVESRNQVNLFSYRGRMSNCVQHKSMVCNWLSLPYLRHPTLDKKLQNGEYFAVVCLPSRIVIYSVEQWIWFLSVTRPTTNGTASYGFRCEYYEHMWNVATLSGLNVVCEDNDHMCISFTENALVINEAGLSRLCWYHMYHELIEILERSGVDELLVYSDNGKLSLLFFKHSTGLKLCQH